MRFRKFLKPYKTRGSSFREHTEIKEGDIFGLVVSGFPFAKKAQSVKIEGNKQIIRVSEVSQEEAFQDIDVQGSSGISLTAIETADEENIKLCYIVGGTRERSWTDGQKYENLVGISESEVTAVEIIKTYELSPKQRAQFEIADGVNAQISCTIENIDVDWKNSSTECMVLLNSDVNFHFNLSIDVFQALGAKPSVEVARVPVLLFGYASISASLDLSGSVTLDVVEYSSLGIKYIKHNRFGDRFRFVKEFRKKSFTIQAKTKLTITLTLMFGFDLGFMNGNLNGDWGATVTVDTKTFNDGEAPNTCMHVESWMFVSEITGAEILELAWNVIEDMQYMGGGMVVFLEANDEERLLSFYQANKFWQFDTRLTASDLENQHELVQLLRLL